MFLGPEYRRDSDPRSADLRERHLHSGLRLGGVGRGRSWRAGLRTVTEAEPLLRIEGDQHAAGVRGSRKRVRGECQSQRANLSIVLTGVFLMLVCGLGCRPRESAEASFKNAQRTLRRGELIRAQQEAEQGYYRFHSSSPEWATKFRNLHAEALLLRGMYLQALTLLESDPSVPGNQDLM